MHTLHTTEGQEHLCKMEGQGTRNLGSRWGPSWQVGMEEPVKAEEEQVQGQEGVCAEVSWREASGPNAECVDLTERGGPTVKERRRR